MGFDHACLLAVLPRQGFDLLGVGVDGQQKVPFVVECIVNVPKRREELHRRRAVRGELEGNLRELLAARHCRHLCRNLSTQIVRVVERVDAALERHKRRVVAFELHKQRGDHARRAVRNAGPSAPRAKAER